MPTLPRGRSHRMLANRRTAHGCLARAASEQAAAAIGVGIFIVRSRRSCQVMPLSLVFLHAEHRAPAVWAEIKPIEANHAVRPMIVIGAACSVIDNSIDGTAVTT